MNFKKLERSCRIESGWRLATVEEAQENVESIKSVLQGWEWERGRLLDGWIGGSAYNFQATVGFRSCLGFMVVVQSPTTPNREIGSSGQEKAKGVYSKLHLSEEGRSAALFLCCEDWNYDVVCWLLSCWSQTEREKEIIANLTEEMAEASELVSELATKLQRTLMTRPAKGQFSQASTVAAMFSDIVKSLEERVQGMPIFAEPGVVYDEFLHDLHLTEDLERFQIFGPGDSTWEVIAGTLWDFAADAIAVTTVRNFALLKEKNIHGTILTQEGTTEDQALIASIFSWANQFLNEKYNDYAPLWGKVRDAGVNKFDEILHPQAYGTFNYESRYGVLNTIILKAAKDGDPILVNMLINCGVQPLETPDEERRKTALHHAAKLDNESYGIVIAATLLKRSEKLANAPDYKWRTPLHRAASCRGHAAMCDLLIKHKASVYYRDKKGQIPLHYALDSEQQDEKVIRVLIENDIICGNTVDTKDNKGMTPLHLAVEFQSNNVRMVTWLLSLSSQPEAYFEQRKLASYLRHSSRMGYHTLVKTLLNRGANPLDIDDEGKTAFHYAVGGKDETAAMNIINVLGAAKEELVTGDKYGRSVLHIAAFMGHKGLCQHVLSFYGIDVDACKDRDGHNALYYAVAGTHDDDEVLDALVFTSSSAQGINKVFLKDSSGTTPLHIAAEKGNIKMVEKLLSKRLIPQPQKREEFVRSADVLGQTALHKAASGGHKKVVKKLLEEKAHPLTERDCDGKTALHYAVQAEESEGAMAIAKLLLKKCDSPKEKALLLFASAVGIGSAEESSTSKPSLKEYLAKERASVTEEVSNLLRVAASLGNIDMTRELLSRGGNIAHIRRPKWRDQLRKEEKDNVQHVLKQIDNIVEQGTDQPTLSDNLGRSAFANGLAALFLNPFVKPPITVGISGEWGMGKSSVMIQTESILLKTSAQLLFSDSLQKENFPGASKLQLTAKGERKLEKIKYSIRQLSATKNTKNDSHSKISAEERNPLSDLLSNYDQPKYHKVFKSLAAVDRREMFENTQNKEESRSGGGVPFEKDFIADGQMQENSIPSILTVRYNAWQYRNESEAWAGLAVEITRELEQTMTVAEKLRTSWRYNWTTRKQSICVGVFFPCFLAILLALWFTTIVWLVLDQVKVRNATELKYGSLPATVIVVVWALMKSLISVIKPISSQMVDYISLPDHSEKLGYHLKVINDINFLKNELGYKASWLWKIFGFIWCFITFSWDEKYVPETRIPKMTPASGDNLRIVVFVDDLDRCQENVILQVLSAINLVLAACKINVILGMDKTIIQRAIIRMFGDKNNKPAQSSQDLADKYLRKIIQLPLDLPDPSPSESKFFLDGQLGMLDTRKGASGLEIESQIQTAGALRKRNPKFRMGNFNDWDSKRGSFNDWDSKRGIKETMASLGETGVIKGNDFVSGTAREGVNQHLCSKKLERIMETIEDQDTEVKEGKNHISDTSAREGITEHKQTIEDSGKETTINIQLPHESTGIKGTPQGEQQIPDDHVPNTYWNLVASNIKKLMALMSSFWSSLMACLRSKHAENSEIEQQLLEKSPITYEMIIPKYSEGERDTFYFFQTHTTGNRKLPRDWKRLLTYHRLAWNILSKSSPVKTLAGWQVQLIAWIFVCWQWKNQINTIIQEWHDLGALKYWIAVHDNQPGDMVHEQTRGPSLKEIVQHYIDERWPKGKKSSSVSDQLNLEKSEEKNISIGEKAVQGIIRSTSSSASTSTSASASTSTSKEEDIREDEDHLKEEEREKERGQWLKQTNSKSRRNKKGKQKCKQVQEPDHEGPKIMIKEILQNKDVENWVKQILRNVLKEEREKENRQKGRKEASKKGKMKVEMEEEEKERKEWEKLRETLSRYNVTMDGIQAFQQFRFYCVPGHLPWPLHKPDVNFT